MKGYMLVVQLGRCESIFLPKDFCPDNNMKRGDSDWKITGDGYVVLKWMGNKPVFFLGNFHNPRDTELVSRKQNDGSSTQFSCLKLVKDYNKHLGYVDKSDMLKSCYEVDRKSKKWWHRIFWHFLDLTIVIAFIIFKEGVNDNTGETLSLENFCLAVANSLIGVDTSAPNRGRRNTEINVNTFKVHVSLEKQTNQFICQFMESMSDVPTAAQWINPTGLGGIAHPVMLVFVSVKRQTISFYSIRNKLNKKFQYSILFPVVPQQNYVFSKPSFQKF
ncbi:hypothetical protein NQ314_018201 [Rhamnusium bicolor]|uniref:PiggyBac transposable element-derived protein domain-containing protein n=1 Tax=Rhamnusium bicolor TaxID=1586634 RepID=A0AAV8WRV2_9CUCU|nr:hypothetical protein NQ314_018201 [Rhamnusium bicolor]